MSGCVNIIFFQVTKTLLVEKLFLNDFLGDVVYFLLSNGGPPMCENVVLRLLDTRNKMTRRCLAFFECKQDKITQMLSGCWKRCDAAAEQSNVVFFITLIN